MRSFPAGSGDDASRQHDPGHLRRPRRHDPVFDINPNPYLALPRATAVNGAALRTDELAGLRSAAGWFGLRPTGARDILAEIQDVVGGWAEVAATNGISHREPEQFAPIFDRV